MKEGKSKVTKCEFTSEFESQYGKLFGFKVAFEDGTEGLYNSKSKDAPKFKVGEEAPYSAEEKTNKNGNKFWSIKYRNENQGGFGGGYKGRPSYSSALEMARKMFNSSAQTDDVWDMEKLTKMASYLLGKLKSGVDKDAVETAVTIQCAQAMGGKAINPKALDSQIKNIQGWINENK